MSLLTIIQNIAGEMGLTVPTAIIGSTDRQVIQLHRAVLRTGYELRQRHDWPELLKEGSITLADGVAEYDLPADFDRIHFETQWNDDQSFPLIGPMSPQEYEAWQHGHITPAIHQHFIAKGRGGQITIYPTPGAAEDGEVCYFAYQSTDYTLPELWVAGATISAPTVRSYARCSYQGRIYEQGSSGSATCGTTAPTHTTVGSGVSDGVTTWYYSDESDWPGSIGQRSVIFEEDNDFSVIDEELVELGAKWRFKRENGETYKVFQDDYYRAIPVRVTARKAAKTLSLRGPRRNNLSLPTIPEGNW